MVRPFGYELELEKAIEKFSGRSLQECLEMVEEEVQQKLPPDFIEEFRKRTFEAFKHHVKPVKKVPQLLDKLTIPYCAASSGPIEKIELNLKTAGLFEKFEGRIFSSYEINSWKPDPGIFLYAAEKMGFQPKECLVIEDALAGLQAAKAGGFDVYGFSNGKNRDKFDKIADRTFLDMEELEALIT